MRELTVKAKALLEMAPPLEVRFAGGWRTVAKVAAHSADYSCRPDLPKVGLWDEDGRLLSWFYHDTELVVRVADEGATPTPAKSSAKYSLIVTHEGGTISFDGTSLGRLVSDLVTLLDANPSLDKARCELYRRTGDRETLLSAWVQRRNLPR